MPSAICITVQSKDISVYAVEFETEEVVCAVKDGQLHRAREMEILPHDRDYLAPDGRSCVLTIRSDKVIGNGRELGDKVLSCSCNMC
jgi:hypothetical protein